MKGENGGQDASANGTIKVETAVVVEPSIVTPTNIAANASKNAISFSWNAVEGAEKYIVKLCYNKETQVEVPGTGGGGSGKSLVFDKAEITEWKDGSVAASLKTGNGITIAQIGTQSKKGEYMQVGQGNTTLTLADKSKDAVLITANEAIDHIVVTFGSNTTSATKPYVGFSAGSYNIGSGAFTADLGCSNQHEVKGNVPAAKTYACPAGTKSIVLARNMACDGTMSNVSFRIAKIEVVLKGGGTAGEPEFVTETETVCKEYTATANSLNIDNLEANTAYTYQVKAIGAKAESAFSTAATVTTTGNDIPVVEPLVVPTNISAVPAQTSIDFAWNAVEGAERYIVKLCREVKTEIPGTGAGKSLTFNKSEMDKVADGSAASTLKSGNGITIAQIGTESVSGDYIQVGQGNADLTLANKGKDAVLITAGEAIDHIVVTFGSNKDDAAVPFVGFSAGNYKIGSGEFSADLGCSNQHSVAGKTQVAKTYACPAGTKSIILARNASCDGKSSNVTFRISKIEVFLKAGSTVVTETVCDDTYVTNTNSIAIGNLSAGTAYTYQVKALRGSEETAYSAAKTVSTLTQNRAKQTDETIAEAQALSITIYPNPVKDVVYVQSAAQIAKVEIYSIGGALVAQDGNFNESMQVSELPTGVYILRAYTAEGTAATAKLIKE